MLKLGRSRRDGEVLLAVLSVVVALAWVALWVGGHSPYGRYLDHRSLDRVKASGIAVLLLFVGGWTLMTVAMMLPTAAPLFAMFSRVVGRRENRGVLLTLVAAGYLLVWTLFGMVAYGADLILHTVARHQPWLADNAWIIAGATLGLAGLYQFSTIKYRCLDKCRTPRMFIMQRWPGSREHFHSFMLGVDHGAFCVGCCWTLMILMFAVGAGNIAWMLLFGALMAVEKNSVWGRLMTAPLGGVLLAASSFVVVTNIS